MVENGGDTKNSVIQARYIMFRAQCKMEVPAKVWALLSMGACVTGLFPHCEEVALASLTPP